MQEPFRISISHLVSAKLKSHTCSRKILSSFSIICLLSLSAGSALFSQETPRHQKVELIKSMGMPEIWKPYLGPMFAWQRWESRNTLAGELNAGVYKDLTNPVIGLFGTAGEGYLRAGGDRINGGVRLLACSRVFFTQAGADYSFSRGRLEFILSLLFPLRRGGLLHKGDNLRLDFFPGQKSSLSFGLSLPLGQPFLGRTRPNTINVSLSRLAPVKKSTYAASPELIQTLVNLRHAAYWINLFDLFFLEDMSESGKPDTLRLIEMINRFKNHIHHTDSLYPEGHTFEAEVNVYHQQLERVFTLSAKATLANKGEPDAGWIAQKAREILLEEVILPYNRLLGQRKKPDSIQGLSLQAFETFEAWIKESPEIREEDKQAIKYVFLAVVDCLEQSRSLTREFWGDSRLVWIPMHLGLRLEDHDTGTEIDALVQKATGQKFVDGNDVHYVINELFQPELERMIKKAEDYHILWIHDYRGLNDDREPDEISYRLTLTYLETFIDRVRVYQRSRKIPVYMLFLDQHYFEVNHSRLWLEFLEAPLVREIHLPPKYRLWEQTILNAQKELRLAVSQSSALQADAQAFGNKWLENQIKLQINITNPSDLTYRASTFFNIFPVFPDNLIRDHRKITFYDITELDPGKGEAMYTGMGIGEHYVGPTWDDRSVLVRGPVLVSLKDSARELLLSQGFEQKDIPEPLRPAPEPPDYDQMVENLRAQGWTAVAMQVHNATGFGAKPATVVKAALYDLMPKGSHMYIPCSLWNDAFWASMLVGSALRGCVILVVTPSFQNAPSDGILQMSRANELFTRFVIIQNYLSPEIESSGGFFKVGIYSMDLDVGDNIGKIRSLNKGIAQSKVFQKIFPFAPCVVQTVARMPEVLESQGFKPDYLYHDSTSRKAKLHLKSQFFATETAIKTAVPLEAWEPVVRKYILARAKQASGRANGTYVDAKELRSELAQDVASLMSTWREGVTPEERDKATVYLTVGSHNQDYRSMVMEGEDIVVVAHYWAWIAYLDFVNLMAQTTWITDVNQLEELLPKQKGFWRWLARYLKITL